MRRVGLALLLLSTLALGQGGSVQPASAQTSHRGQTLLTPSDMYCAGFISTQLVPETSYVAAGWNSPDQSHYAGKTDFVYIYGASGFKAGDLLHIVRRVKDPNHYELYPGEKKAIAEVGQPYFERGYVRVLEVQKNVAITVPELSCGEMVTGDLAIPFAEREKPVLHPVTLDRFTVPNGKPTGRIVMTNEFDSVIGSGQKVYLNIGEDKGLKVGDYLRATRTYPYSYHDPIDGLSTLATYMEDTQKAPPKLPKDKIGELPRRTLGDMVVLTVHHKSATAMIITALEDIHVGDGVEVMDDSH
jgi:hypothetical protein